MSVRNVTKVCSKAPESSIWHLLFFTILFACDTILLPQTTRVHACYLVRRSGCRHTVQNQHSNGLHHHHRLNQQKEQKENIPTQFRIHDKEQQHKQGTSGKCWKPDLPTNKLLSSAWLGSSKPSSHIVNSKPNQAVMDSLLDRLDRLDSSEHVTCLRL